MDTYNTFHASEVNNLGVSNASTTSTFPLTITDERGYLKLSPDGTKMACANARDGMYLYDFDSSTGIVSNQKVLFIGGLSGNPYGVEFSPNSKLLYVHSSNDFFGDESGDPSYLGMTLDEAAQMDGVYESWCGDVDNFIEQNIWYTSQMYSLHDLDLPTGLFENPENLDKVNYRINTFYVGMEVAPLTSTCTAAQTCGGDKLPEALTYGDIQVAIWTLVEDTLPDNLSDFAALAEWSQERVNAILCDVNDNADVFLPTCATHPFMLTSFIVVPDDGAQLQISTIQVPCETTDGTAWGDGKFGEVFPGAKQWGTYFNYDANCVNVP